MKALISVRYKNIYKDMINKFDVAVVIVIYEYQLCCGSVQIISMYVHISIILHRS